MRHYRTIAEARQAMALDDGFDRFAVYGGRPTKALMAEIGYPVDPVQAERERQEAAAREEARRQEEGERDTERREWEARPRTQIYRAAAAIGVGGNCVCVEIGDALAHVSSDDPRAPGVAVVERQPDGRWIARAPRDGEKIYR